MKIKSILPWARTSASCASAPARREDSDTLTARSPAADAVRSVGPAGAHGLQQPASARRGARVPEHEPSEHEVAQCFQALHEGIARSGRPLDPALLRTAVHTYLRKHKQTAAAARGREASRSVPAPIPFDLVTKMVGILLSDATLAPLGDARLEILSALLNLGAADITYLGDDGVSSESRFTSTTQLLASVFAHAEIFGLEGALAIARLICTPPSTARTHRGPSRARFEQLMHTAAFVTESKPSLTALACGLLHLPADVRLDATKLIYKHGVPGLLHVQPSIAVELAGLGFQSAEDFDTLDKRLTEAFPLPIDAAQRAASIVEQGRIVAAERASRPAAGHGVPPAPKTLESPRISPLPLPGAPKDIRHEQGVVDAEGVFRTQSGAPRFQILSRLAVIDSLLGSVEVGLDLQDNTLCCLKGLTLGCRFAVADSGPDLAARHTAISDGLRHEAAMAAASDSALTPKAVYTTPHATWLQMPIMFGSLQGLVETHANSGDRPLALLLGMRSVLAQLSHMHAQDLVHRDIKPDNILHRGTSNVQIADFEMVKKSAEMRRAGGGTPVYQAPEQEKDRALGKAPWQLNSLKPADVYGVGTTFVALFTNDLYFRDYAASSAARRELLSKMETPSMESGLDPQRTKAGLVRLMGSMISPWPAFRPTAKQALARLDKLLKGVDPAAGEHYWAMMAGAHLKERFQPLKEAGLAELPAEAGEAYFRQRRRLA